VIYTHDSLSFLLAYPPYTDHTMHTPVEQIKGNATDEHKALLNATVDRFNAKGYFCYDIMDRMTIAEAGYVDNSAANDEGMGVKRRRSSVLYMS